jgi:murein DD-endopeptidase MepM/ murein hydrolase activator NlpD
VTATRTCHALVLVGLLCGPAPAAAEPKAGHVALRSAPPQQSELALPFVGEWAVVQGADSDGTHQGYAAYALDFVPAVPVSEEAFRERKRLDQHPCYGRPILAPADARVVLVHDGARERPPFKESAKHDGGNFVILQHAKSEFSEFRHLQPGSILVKRDDAVLAGQIIGRCGNSGNAVTPHLHVGLLGSYRPIATRPLQFSNYQVRNAQGEWETGDGVPKQGQIVRPAPLSDSDPARKPHYRAFWLYPARRDRAQARRDTEYPMVLLTRVPMAQLAAAGEVARWPSFFAFATYQKDSLWVQPDSHLRVPKNFLDFQGETATLSSHRASGREAFHVEKAARADLVRLIDNPEGTIPIARTAAPANAPDLPLLKSLIERVEE